MNRFFYVQNSPFSGEITSLLNKDICLLKRINNVFMEIHLIFLKALKIKSLLFLVFFCNLLCSQNNPQLKNRFLTKFNFKEYKIAYKKDTIVFYLHKKKNSTPNKLVIYLQGTTPVPEPFFKVEKTEKGYAYETYFPTDYEFLNENYVYVIISYVGISAFKNDGLSDLKTYHEKNSLDYRVNQVNKVINYIHRKVIKKLSKTIVYGHSEGAPVAAKLGTINNKITHIGFWGGTAMADFYDFILLESKKYYANETTHSQKTKKINSIIEDFNAISIDNQNTNPLNINEITEYTNKRWWSYAEPPLYHLLKIKIPIFVQVATEDNSSPIESSYLIPLEFIRMGKKNLSFNVCENCDHGFVQLENGIETDKWSEIFVRFINWTENQ